MLRDIAKQVVAHGVPKSRDEWRALKGVGPYTSAALASFCLREPAVPIDTNIRRVLGRSLLGKTFPTLADDARIEHAALKTWPKDDRVCDLPQALFDLAVAVCVKSPACAVCPLKTQCKAAPKFMSGRVRIPKRTIKKAHETKHRNKPYPDRIYRGRILALVRTGHISSKTLGSKIDPTYDAQLDEDWIFSMLDRMEKDGLIQRNGNTLRLG